MVFYGWCLLGMVFGGLCFMGVVFDRDGVGWVVFDGWCLMCGF